MKHKQLNRIKVALVEKRRTGVWLAEQLGVSSVTVSKWCSNTTQPTLQTLDKIAELLEIDKRELLTGN
ncbi:MAG: helix-turn-helix transcriptional regulator [Bacteroidaceae bacterium]|nr:helix-turn-helix transcriptional regulator [Bacteroidaceae bacterium]